MNVNQPYGALTTERADILAKLASKHPDIVQRHHQQLVQHIRSPMATITVDDNLPISVQDDLPTWQAAVSGAPEVIEVTSAPQAVVDVKAAKVPRSRKVKSEESKRRCWNDEEMIALVDLNNKYKIWVEGKVGNAHNVNDVDDVDEISKPSIFNAKYNNIMTEYRKAKDALKATGGRGLQFYRERYCWWDKMEGTNTGNASIEPNYVYDNGVERDSTPERSRKRYASSQDDDDTTQETPPRSSLRRKKTTSPLAEITQMSKELNQENREFMAQLELQQEEREAKRQVEMRQAMGELMAHMGATMLAAVADPLTFAIINDINNLPKSATFPTYRTLPNVKRLPTSSIFLYARAPQKMPQREALDHALCHVDPAGIPRVAYDTGMYDWSISDCNTWGAVLGKILVEWLCRPDRMLLPLSGCSEASILKISYHCRAPRFPSARMAYEGCLTEAGFQHVGAHIKPAPLGGIVETDPADGVTLKTVRWALNGSGPRSKTWNFHEWDNQNRQQAVAILESAKTTIRALYDAHSRLQQLMLDCNSPVVTDPLGYHRLCAVGAISRLLESLTIIQLDGAFVFMADMNDTDICVAFGNNRAVAPSRISIRSFNIFRFTTYVRLLADPQTSAIIDDFEKPPTSAIIDDFEKPPTSAIIDDFEKPPTSAIIDDFEKPPREFELQVSKAEFSFTKVTETYNGTPTVTGVAQVTVFLHVLVYDENHHCKRLVASVWAPKPDARPWHLCPCLSVSPLANCQGGNSARNVITQLSDDRGGFRGVRQVIKASPKLAISLMTVLVVYSVAAPDHPVKRSSADPTPFVPNTGNGLSETISAEFSCVGDRMLHGFSPILHSSGTPFTKASILHHSSEASPSDSSCAYVGGMPRLLLHLRRLRLPWAILFCETSISFEMPMCAITFKLWDTVYHLGLLPATLIAAKMQARWYAG
ncbi:hypothetical protein DFJ77DRAFT_443487 [Powellomyces hirtus]|nr:hypothetical protein DFJ77DRAFT_443487 [Powellomyces hirtus]